MVPLESVADGEQNTIDAEKYRIDNDLSPVQLAERKNTWSAPPFKATRGTLYNYIKTVKTSSDVCVTDE